MAATRDNGKHVDDKLLNDDFVSLLALRSPLFTVVCGRATVESQNKRTKTRQRKNTNKYAAQTVKRLGIFGLVMTRLIEISIRFDSIRYIESNRIVQKNIEFFDISRYLKKYRDISEISPIFLKYHDIS